MNDMIKHTLLSGMMLCALLFSAQAQTGPGLNKEVQVTRAYDPIISDANKIALPIQSSDTLLSIRGGYQYQVKPPVLQAGNFSLRPIPAARISGNDYEDPQWLYARLGMGYPLRPQLDVYASNTKPDNLSVGVQYNLQSIWASINNPLGSDRPNIPIDELKHGATGFIDKQFEKIDLSAELGFKQHQVLFYGYDTGILNPERLPSFKFSKDSLSQRYTSIFGNVGVKSISIDPLEFRYGAKAVANLFGDNGKGRFDHGRMFSMKENSFGGNAFLSKTLGDGQHLVRLDADYRLYQRTLSYNAYYNNTPVVGRIGLGNLYQSLFGAGVGRDTSNMRMLLNLHPSYQLTAEKLHLDLGLTFSAFKQHNNSKTRLFPMINVRYNAANGFVPYARLDGGVSMNDYQSIASENPYVSPGMNMDMNATEQLYSATLGFTGAAGSVFTYNAYGSYSAYRDMYFYVNASRPLKNTPYSLHNNFDVLYDDANLLKVGAELQATFSTVRSTLSAAYLHYMLDELPTPYHRPSLVADWNTDVTVSRDWIFSLAVHAQGQTPYLYSTGTETSMNNKAFFDINLGGEYLVNRSFSVFVLLNNIANQKYEVWHQYVTPGFGFVGGITLKL